MIIFKRIFSILVVISAIMTVSCELGTPEESDLYNFKVVGYLGNFDGYYSIDGGDLQTFAGVQDTTSTNYYIYETNLETPESVMITVNGSTTCATVSVYIYAGEELVESGSDGATDSGDDGIYDDLAYVYIDYDFTSSTTSE